MRSKVVNVVLIELQRIQLQRFLQVGLVHRQQLRLGERGARHELPKESLRLPDHAFDFFVVAIAGLPHDRVHIELVDSAEDGGMQLEPLQQAIRFL